MEKINIPTIIAEDGEDKIIFTETYNLYNDTFVLRGFLGYVFKFVFENISPKEGQKDILVEKKPEDAKEIVITLSKKFRNSLGSISTEKLLLFETSDKKRILLSIYGQQVGMGPYLNITINFYLR